MSAVILALGAAVVLALASVLQQGAAAAVPAHHGIVALIWRLLRSPRWLIGRVFDTVGLVLMALALGRGSFIAVQAIVATSVVIALIIEAASHRRRLSARAITGSCVVVFGVVVLLSVIGLDDTSQRSSTAWWIGAFVLVAAAVGAIIASTAGRNPRPVAMAMAGATSLCFALDASALKAASQVGYSRPMVLVPLAAFVLAAVTGNVLIHRAFHLAPLAVSLPTLTAALPLASVVAGAALFGETPHHGAIEYALAAVAVVCLTGGAFVAAQSAPATNAEPELVDQAG